MTVIPMTKYRKTAKPKLVKSSRTSKETVPEVDPNEAAQEEAALSKLQDIEDLELGVSSFQKQYKRLRDNTGRSDIDEYDTIEHIMMLKALFYSTRNLISLAELQYKHYKNERASYAWKALVEMSMQIMNDLRILQGNNGQAEKISDFVKQGITTAVQHLIDNSYGLKKSLQSSVKSDRLKEKIDTIVEEHIKLQGSSLNEVYKMIDAQIKDLFSHAKK